MQRGHLGVLIETLESEGLRHRYPDVADELLAKGGLYSRLVARQMAV